MAPRHNFQSASRVPDREQLLTVGHLQDFREELLFEIQSMFKTLGGTPGKQWLKSAEVKKLLGISHGFLQRLRDYGTLPYSKIGGSIYYAVSDIEKMMEGSRFQDAPIQKAWS